jgi:four helix bundle protein
MNQHLDSFSERKGGWFEMMVQYHWELDVYQLAKEGRKQIFDLSQSFPKEEMYSLTDQIRRSSRAICAQIAEAWGRRLYRADFINRLNQAESEARETQCWLETALECEYVTKEVAQQLFRLYNNVIGKLITIENSPDRWLLKSNRARGEVDE